ncbi:hypothetical protein Csa_022204 [Cucumis sativus]|uniref:Uncharacterized protein n=1 Tax=Cucumis sativus TaxID=3659 RepID=A0A0A0LLI7_CUCSA|nr:hypothetical protein Csa_022204 [Cucumis sativus]
MRETRVRLRKLCKEEDERRAAPGPTFGYGGSPLGHEHGSLFYLDANTESNP